MTLHDVFGHLWDIGQAAFSLLLATDFHSEDGLSPFVCPRLADAAQDTFLRDKAQELLESLKLLHEQLCYLRQPIRGEYQLQQFADGRWGYYDGLGNLRIFTSGRTIEAKIPDRFGGQRWIQTRFEHDGDGYYLWCGGGVSLAGLTIRERGTDV